MQQLQELTLETTIQQEVKAMTLATAAPAEPERVTVVQASTTLLVETLRELVKVRKVATAAMLFQSSETRLTVHSKLATAALEVTVETRALEVKVEQAVTAAREEIPVLAVQEVMAAPAALVALSELGELTHGAELSVS
jgi:hypothetical protein